MADDHDVALDIDPRLPDSVQRHLDSACSGNRNRTPEAPPPRRLVPRRGSFPPWDWRCARSAKCLAFHVSVSIRCSTHSPPQSRHQRDMRHGNAMACTDCDTTTRHARLLRTVTLCDSDTFTRPAEYQGFELVSRSQKCHSPYRPGVSGRDGGRYLRAVACGTIQTTVHTRHQSSARRNSSMRRCSMPSRGCRIGSIDTTVLG